MNYLWILLRSICLATLYGFSRPSALSAQPFQLPHYEHITDRNGLPQAFVGSITQDEKGFIWIATLDGFCRYDGDRLRLFQHSPEDSSGLPEPGVISIQPDRNGKLWVQTQKELELFDPVKETFFHLSQQPFYKNHIKNPPRIIHPGRNRRIWLSNEDGLSVADLTTGSVMSWRHDPGNPYALCRDEIQAIAEDRNGVLWIATYGSGLGRLDEKQAGSRTTGPIRVTPMRFPATC